MRTVGFPLMLLDKLPDVSVNARWLYTALLLTTSGAEHPSALVTRDQAFEWGFNKDSFLAAYKELVDAKLIAVTPTRQGNLLDILNPSTGVVLVPREQRNGFSKELSKTTGKVRKYSADDVTRVFEFFIGDLRLESTNDDMLRFICPFHSEHATPTGGKKGSKLYLRVMLDHGKWICQNSFCKHHGKRRGESGGGDLVHFVAAYINRFELLEQRYILPAQSRHLISGILSGQTMGQLRYPSAVGDRRYEVPLQLHREDYFGGNAHGRLNGHHLGARADAKLVEKRGLDSQTPDGGVGLDSQTAELYVNGP